jgi:hypothetical protein
MNPVTNLEKVEFYLKSIENGDFAYIATLFSPDAVLEQLPNWIYPNGIRSEVSRVAEAFEKWHEISEETHLDIEFSIRGCVASLVAPITGAEPAK